MVMGKEEFKSHSGGMWEGHLTSQQAGALKTGKNGPEHLAWLSRNVDEGR